MELRGKTALVTGGSGGIGEQIARQLADRGAHLILVARSADKLDAVASDVRARHPDVRVDVVAADLSVPQAGRELVERVGALGRTVDLLVNNAGAGSHGDLVEEDPDRLAAQLQLDVGTVVDLTARLLPGMVARGFGGVINVASTAAFQPVPTMAVYGAGKAFVLSFTEAVWGETRGTGVRVLTLCPGSTQTGFFDAAGTQFLTRGRQTPQEVAATAVAALDGSAPTVVSGRANRIRALGYRVVPRRVMIVASRWLVRSRG